MTKARRGSAPVCPQAADHTPGPAGYGQWHMWAEEMAKTHDQRQCDGCGLWVMWKRRHTTPEATSDA